MPRTAVKTATVFTFDELSDAAKEVARDKWRETELEYEWWDGIYDDAETAASLLGITLDRKRGATPSIFFSGFSSQGDGACFEGSYRYKKGWLKALRAEFGNEEYRKPLEDIGWALHAAQARQFYQLVANCKQRGHYNHSGCMSVEVSHDESMYRDIGDAEDEIRDALRSFADWIYARLEQEHDWRLEDAQIDESIKSSEAEFLESGKLYV